MKIFEGDLGRGGGRERGGKREGGKEKREEGEWGGAGGKKPVMVGMRTALLSWNSLAVLKQQG